MQRSFLAVTVKEVMGPILRSWCKSKALACWLTTDFFCFEEKKPLIVCITVNKHAVESVKMGLLLFSKQVYDYFKEVMPNAENYL